MAARVAAAGALAGFVAMVAVTVVFVVRHPGAVIAAAVALPVAVAAAWAGATRTRLRLPLLVVAAVLAVASLAVLLAAGHGVTAVLVVVVLAFAASAAGALALRWDVERVVHERWSPAPPARHGVLLMNPRSGGGKVERFDLVGEATKRGVEPVVLGRGDDLRALAEAAVGRGADVLGMAGGDGSQAIVAAVAAQQGVGFVCVPAGTRNHLALDLGVDRNDVVGALDAFGPARQARIDLAAVNGLVFVNNVSLGVYAEVVASEEYRDAKLQTAAAALPDLLGPNAAPSGLDLQIPGADSVEDPQVVMVSNNPYRLERLAGFGTRARLDRGVLGVAALRLEGAADVARFVAAEAAGRVDRFPGWQSWELASFELTSPRDVKAGVDGESVTLTPPLRFEIRSGALVARTSPAHPGISPAARRPGWGRSTFLGLARVVAGRHSGLVA